MKRSRQSGLHVEVVGDESGFRALKDEWDALLASSRQAGPCLTHEWLYAWWRSFGGAHTLVLLCCRDARDGLVGVMPLYSCVRGRYPSVRVLRFLGDPGVGSIGLSGFADPAVEGAVLDRLVESAIAQDWDVLELAGMDPEQSLLPRLLVTSHMLGDYGSCPRIALTPDWETYLGGLSKHMRHEIRRAERRVAEQGVVFERVEDANELPGAIEDYCRLHVSRMRTKLGPHYGVAPEHRDFIERLSAATLEAGILRLTFASREGERLAVLYELRYGDTRYAVQSGFDENCGPSGEVLRALWAATIRDAIAEGSTTLDLMLGDQAYKSRWGVTEVRRLSSVRVYRRSPVATARRGQDGLLRRYPRLAERLLRSGL